MRYLPTVLTVCLIALVLIIGFGLLGVIDIKPL